MLILILIYIFIYFIYYISLYNLNKYMISKIVVIALCGMLCIMFIQLLQYLNKRIIFKILDIL